MPARRLKILIWHIHGSYLNSLARLEHDWYVPFTPERGPRYGGRGASFDLPANMREVPAGQVRDLDLDLVIYQAPENLSDDRERILSPAQRRLPAIYLEHNAPRPHPVETRHIVDDPNMLLVHVTHYNRLMWDSGRTPTVVIEHSAAIDPAARYSGDRAMGVAVINEIARRGRIAGHDLFEQARRQLPINLAGMGSAELGGLGDVPYRQLHRRIAPYRFLYSPMRYTSLPLAVIEAMLMGMPVVALATTELPTVIADGISGFVSCDHGRLIENMRALLADRALAFRMGAAARELAQDRFGLERFASAWDAALSAALGR